jgi:hypothetical protein
MTEISKKLLKKPENPQKFVWESIEGLNLEPRFLTWTLISHEKLKSQKGTHIGSVVCIDVIDTYLNSGLHRQTADRRKFFLAKNHYFIDKNS